MTDFSLVSVHTSTVDTPSQGELCLPFPCDRNVHSNLRSQVLQLIMTSATICHTPNYLNYKKINTKYNMNVAIFLITNSRSARPNYKHSLLIAIAVVCFMLPWQFAQFALMTQAVAVFGTYVLQYIGSHKMKIVLLGQSVREQRQFLICMYR